MVALGQILYGQPRQERDCPEILDAALSFLRHEIGRVLWNIRQEQVDPFSSSAESFKCAAFCVCAYSWSDDPQPWNFKHYKSGIEVSWYKYMGRGMTVNKVVTPDQAAELLRDCMEAMQKVESGEDKYTDPGLYPEGVLQEQQEIVGTEWC